MIDKEALLAAVPRLAGRRVLVVGDLFLDEYLVGRAARLSREAPIPVLEFEERRHLPGGGANPSMNVVALGGRVYQVGLVGADRAGEGLRELLAGAGIAVEGLVVDPERATAVKTRIVAQGSLRFPQQVARLDRVDRQPLSPEVEAQVIDHIRRLAGQVDAVLVSDYRSGLITEKVVEAVREVHAEDRLICVDSQGRLEQFQGLDLVKCNHHEARAYLTRTSGRPVALQADHQFMSASARMRSQLKVQALLITRGADGLDLRGPAGYVHLPAANRSEVFDVTGAGDTVVAVATLALAAGLDWSTAASLANYAAGLVVRKLGVAAPSPQELSWAVRNW